MLHSQLPTMHLSESPLPLGCMPCNSNLTSFPSNWLQFREGASQQRSDQAVFLPFRTVGNQDPLYWW